MGKTIEQWANKSEGTIQIVFACLFIATIGTLAGWLLSITTTLVISFIGVIFIGCYFWDIQHGGGGGSGQLGVFFMVIPAIIIFVLAITITGLIFHWDDLIYMLRGGMHQ